MAQDATEPASAIPPRIVLAARLGIGVAQGLALHLLSRLVADGFPHPWVAANPKGFGLLVLLVTLLPLPVLLGLGHVRGRVLAAWAGVAAGLILLLGTHDLRQHGDLTMTPASNHLLLSLIAILFIGQALVAAADAGRRPWPRYADCFEASWRAGLQLALAGTFVLGFWLIYWIGSALFGAIGIEALNRLGGSSGFVLPVTTVLGAGGIHLADAGWRLTLGLRNLLLGLLGWLTPVLAGLAGAFLVALPFTGLAGLGLSGDAPGWLIAAAGGLVALVSAVHGDGRGAPPALLRESARLASFVLPLLVALAAWLLARQVAGEGLTEGRVVNAALLALLAVHAVAYPIAAARPGMRLLEPANIAGAVLALPVLAALNLPVGDPARLEARSQRDRLLRGAAAPGEFDFHRFQRLGRDGRRVLEELARHPDPEIARLAGRVALPGREPARESAGAGTSLRLRAVPAGTALPAGLGEAMRAALPECVDAECLARAFPPLGEGTWLVGPIDGRFWVMRPEGAAWRRAAIYDAPYTCPGRNLAGLEVEARIVPPPVPDLDLAGTRFRPVLLGEEECR
ncbi:hypothetical protein VQH23_24890 [Pararoseomonas sp. SCSIO 73927]|uniref:hypothetical protein n=1 Tax=Pararoseomonas sp. SCSIO 73927 TaxID=3114537 RepID=UPI0030CE5951